MAYRQEAPVQAGASRESEPGQKRRVTMKRRILTAVLLLSGASTAYAQEAPAPASGPTPAAEEAAQPDELQNEEIIVTARKRAEAERLQDVPLAVTALSGDTIEDRQI